ncbi:hypothetical protein BGZ80_006017 [Entomortierella chlamydospora]|uniref:Uncharacterized protein n=1 Tax=Entomortierella chlamydospora TaxID=101097 RepID=A0A9P6MZE3_9FUNG|nr:hypothetical protein BGZ80_006017 [Entomortierella chlamydospora]
MALHSIDILPFDTATSCCYDLAGCISLPGNPPDLIRLAIEFGHVPFVDHLLYRGFRPRDLPEYFSLIPPLPVVSGDDRNDGDASVYVEANAKGLGKHQTGQSSLLDRSSELHQIWECMRVANQELMDACSVADLDGVLKVLNAILVHPRPALDNTPLQQQESRIFLEAQSGHHQTITNKGKQRQSSFEEYHTQLDSTGSGAVTRVLEDDVASGAGVGSSSSLHQGFAVNSRYRTATVKRDQYSEEPPHPPVDATTIRRSRIFQPRQRVDSESSQSQQHTLSQISSLSQERELSEPPPHMPWVDGRALTSALLAICFRRDGYESEEAEALEESKAVPIVNEILKYDCMLTAQSLGQAILGIAYSRSPGSVRRAHDRRLRRWERQQKQDQNSAPESSRSELASQDGGTAESSESDIDTGVMDLLMERIGPREWLKFIKYYLQRQEFDDLAIILELCPFKGQQLESKDKSIDKDYRLLGRLGPGGELNRRRQQARELICREAGSGTRFTNSYMLPRGGFRGIGGNTSGHSSSVGNNGQGVDSDESFNETEEDSPQSTSGIELGQLSGPPQSQWQHAIDDSDLAGVGSGNESGNESERGNGEGYVEEDEDDLISEQFGPQDSTLAFGGIGSSTTSNSRPGPGIVGIAIQVHAPEHILSALLKMGFRFFSICDLSISDNHHPLAFQFRQQEKLNRLLIEFCMAPSPDSLPGSETDRGTDRKWKMKAPKKKKRDEHKYDAADREYYAQAVEKFLYPTANHLPREMASVPEPLSQVSGSGEGSQASMITEKTAAIESPMNPEVSLASVEEITPTQAPISSLSPSNHLQFVLPPMHLGESVESITAAAGTGDLAGGPSNQNPVSLSSAAIGQMQYHRSGLAKPMPLPIKASTVLGRSIGDVNSTTPMEEDLGVTAASQRMLDETTKCRIREHLSSEHIDLMTVGVCLYQACFHQKELVLGVLLEHRLLIAQDALSGAVQVAASVGWKRGLEMLLMEHGDMEAEIDPVVTTTSDHVHNSTSVKWNHASSEPMRPVESKSNRSTSPNSPKRTGLATFGGLEGYVNRGLRRHRSDGSRLNRSNSGIDDSHGDFGPGGSLRRSLSQSFEATRRSSLDFIHFRAPEPALPPPMLTPPVLGPIIPTIRSSSLKVRISSLLPNLSAPFSSANSIASLKLRKEQKAKKQRQQEQRLGGHSTSNVTHQGSQLQKSQPPVLFLSTSGLYSLPNVMMQRKNRNAVVALMAATSRNDPTLVHWLIETFADIKIAHIMQALMIACDRGFSQVVQALVGSSVTDRDGTKTEEGNSPRLLFRQWLALQYKKIVEATLLTSNSASASASHGSSQQRFDSFPFIFLMESSPVFRHYYQILNTLPSSQFMSQKRSRNRKSPSTAGFQENGGQNSSFTETLYNTQAANSTTSTTTTSPPRLNRRQQQQQQTVSSSSRQRFQPQYSRTRPRTPREIKLEITKIMLEPLLETFGPISFRKALDRIPKDCWWPLDHDVRLIADQEARKAMVAIVTTIKRQQKAQQEQQQRKQHQEHEAQKHQMGMSRDPCQSESKTTTKGTTKRRGWSEKWNRVRNWATIKNRTKTGEPVNTSCEGKTGQVDATALKSFFRRLSTST